MSVDITCEVYEKHIPTCCELRTVEQHYDEILLCYGIISSIKNGARQQTCGQCEYNMERRELVNAG